MKLNLNKNQISIIIEALQQEDTQQSNDLINYIETQLQCYDNKEISLSQLKI